MWTTEKKIKLAVSLILVGGLYAAVIVLLDRWRDDLAVLSALLGTAAGWPLGTFVSPSGKAEAGEFRKFSKIVTAFLTGFVVSKIDQLLAVVSPDNHLPLLSQPHVIRNVMVATICMLLTMMVVFQSRQYFAVDKPRT